MAQFTTIKNGQKIRLYGNYSNHSKNGRPMISLELQIVGKGTRRVGRVGFDCFSKAVDILKKIEIESHDQVREVFDAEFKRFN